MSGRPRRNPVRIYRATADHLLGSLPDGSIDLLVTDPPYATVARRPRGSGHLRDWFPGSQSWEKIGRTLALGRQKLKPTGVAMVMTNPAGLQAALGAMRAAGFLDVRTLTWDRQWPALGTGVRHLTEFILLGRLPGSRPLSGSDLISVAAIGPGTADRYPTSKPVELGRVLAAMVGVGPRDFVVDPFCGSGALLLGAAERGATVIGGDISPRAVAKATALLATALPQDPHPTGRGTAATPDVKSGSATVARRRVPGRPAATGPRQRPSGQAPVAQRGTTGRPSGVARPPWPSRRRR